MSELDDLFKPTVESPVAKQNSTSSYEYKPSADKGTNGIYKSLIRFVPFWKHPSQSVISKWTCFLKDPISDSGRMVDCPSSIGEKDSPLANMYWKLKKSDNAIWQAQAQRFSRKQSFSCLIQVLKDDNNPDLEGKILVWRFGIKVWEKIESEMNPEIGNPYNPFDIINNKLFSIKIVKVSGYNNYDQCKFVDVGKNGYLQMLSEDGKKTIVDENSDKVAVLNYLKANSPDLDEYKFQAWDSDTKSFVYNVINIVNSQLGISDSDTTLSVKTTASVNSNVEISDIGLSTNKSTPTISGVDDLDLDSLENSLNSVPEPPSSFGDLDDVMNSI